MKRFWVLILTLLLAGCAAPGPLTLERVETLSTQGEALTWSDFEAYPYLETGSGLYIRVYDVGEDYQLWIGGGLPEDGGPPMYIRLVRVDDPDDAIDIRYDDVADFIRNLSDPKKEAAPPLLFLSSSVFVSV